MAYALAVTLQTRPGCRQRVLEVIDELRAVAEASGECLAHVAHVPAADPDSIWLYECYSSEGYHRDVHLAVPRVQELLEELTPLIVLPWIVWQGDTWTPREKDPTISSGDAETFPTTDRSPA